MRCEEAVPVVGEVHVDVGVPKEAGSTKKAEEEAVENQRFT